jgi:hypothetical protein
MSDPSDAIPRRSSVMVPTPARRRPLAGHPFRNPYIVDEADEDEDDESETSVELVSKDSKNKLVCPDCRHAIDRAPFPVFVIKDVADHIRVQEQPAGLLWDGSRAPSEGSAAVKLPSPEPPVRDAYALGARSPRQPKSPEPKKPVWDPKDKTWGGLFPDQKKNDTFQKATRRGMADYSDGVHRCVFCNWEIEDGTCNHW